MKDKTYIAYQIEGQDDIVIAMLSMYSFESFEENGEDTIGYISRVNNHNEAQDISDLLASRDVNFSLKEIEHRNWNAEWESSFQPVVIDDLVCIRADFHPSDNACKYDIVINPKMAFGTGHHETTFMMSLAMNKIELSGAKVFDYGCGTGILAILASMLGADEIDAIDIEEESYLNTMENAAINDITNIKPKEATLENFNGSGYNVILANINRNVLIASVSELNNRLNDDGVLLISGILKEDQALIEETYLQSGFVVEDILNKGNWLCIKMNKNGK